LNVIYVEGTRGLKANTKHSVSPNTSLSHGNVVERGEKLRPSVVGRAERALLRGNQIRERILERHQGDFRTICKLKQYLNNL